MARTSKITNPTVTTEITAEKAALITVTRCRKCNKPLPNADDHASVSREGKVTCANCLAKNLPDYVGVANPSDNPVSAMEAALARNTKPVEPVETVEPAPAPTVEKAAKAAKPVKAAATTGMVPLTEQLTETEKKQGKVVVTEKNADGTVAALGVRLKAREFILLTVQAAAENLTDIRMKTEVLKQLGRINPPVLSDDKKAEQLETLKRARAIWAQQTAERRAAAAKAKK